MQGDHGYWVADDAIEAGAEIEVGAGLVVVSWWGTLTERRMPVLASRVSKALRPAIGVVMDFTGTLILASDDAIAESLAEQPGLSLWCPVAIVGGMQFSRFLAYQERAALLGPMTDVFAGREGALRWVRAQMFVHREMLARKRAASGPANA